jgi:hypothetical protein
LDTSIADEQAHSEVLQSMEDTLTKESKACPTIAHVLHELECMDLSLDDAVASRQAHSVLNLLTKFDSAHVTRMSRLNITDRENSDRKFYEISMFTNTLFLLAEIALHRI